MHSLDFAQQNCFSTTPFEISGGQMKVGSVGSHGHDSFKEIHDPLQHWPLGHCVFEIQPHSNVTGTH